jgi:tetratricopeptide (TPR) repeat protein
MTKKTLGRLRWMLALVLVAVVGATWGAGMAELYEKGMERYARSDFQGALTYWKSGLELAREQDNRRIESVFLTNLSVVYRNLGQYPKALEHLRQALAIDREIGDRKGEGHDLTNLGVVYWSLGQYPKALEHYRQALAIFAQLDVPGKRNAEANIGDVHLERGQYSEALEIFQRLNAPVRLGRYYLKTQDYAQARQWFAKSLQKAEASQVAEFLLADHIGLGLAAEGLKDLEQARQHYRKAVDLIEAQREELTPAQRRHFFQAKVQGFARLSPYEGLARIAARLGQAGEALHWSEHTKARVLLEDLARKGPDNPIGLPPELAAQEAELNRELAVVHKQIQIAREQDNRAFLQEREARLAQLKSERQAFLTRLRRSHPEYAAIQYPAPIGLADLKLAPHEVLIQYEVTDRTTLAWLIKGGKVRLDFGHFGSFPGS